MNNFQNGDDFSTAIKVALGSVGLASLFDEMKDYFGWGSPEPATPPASPPSNGSPQYNPYYPENPFNPNQPVNPVNIHTLIIFVICYLSKLFIRPCLITSLKKMAIVFTLI